LILLLSFSFCLLFPRAAWSAWPETAAAESFSGQFTVLNDRVAQRPFSAPDLETNLNFVRLEPSLVIISCERIKQLLTRELGPTAPSQSRFLLALYPPQSADDLVTITSDQFRDGWHYRIDLPQVIDQERYVRAIVQVLLLELANRNAREHSAEIPLWLSEGLTSQLLATSALEIILPPPGQRVNGLTLRMAGLSARREDPLGQVRKQLTARPPLSFEELSWPKENQMAGEAGDLYRNSAQLFVGELLRLEDGPAGLRDMLADLPQHFNWQFAFLHGFHAHFSRLLDVEKWWAMQVLKFTPHDLTQTWPLPESCQKLDETLHVTVQVRAPPGEPPLHSQVTLQAILGEGDAAHQATVLQNKIYELDLLRPRVASQLAGLVASYRGVLDTFLRQCDEPAAASVQPAFRRRATDEALKQLNALDTQRQALQLSDKAIAASPPARQ